jgi:opacity protein-like surface antigen
VKALVAAAVFTLPLGDRFELFAKPGFAYWMTDTSVYVDDPLAGEIRFSQDDDDGAFFIGVGAGLNLGEHFGIRLEYEWFEVTPKWDEYEEEFVQELDASASFLSASFVYRF